MPITFAILFWIGYTWMKIDGAKSGMAAIPEFAAGLAILGMIAGPVSAILITIYSIGDRVDNVKFFFAGILCGASPLVVFAITII